MFHIKSLFYFSSNDLYILYFLYTSIHEVITKNIDLVILLNIEDAHTRLSSKQGLCSVLSILHVKQKV